MAISSNIRTSAGTTFSVTASAPATYDKSGFAALTFTKVGQISDLGSFGKKANLVTFSPLGDRVIIKRKGTYNSGTMSVKMASAPTDAGQIVMKAAASSDNSVACRIVTQSGSTYYFTAQVMGWQLDIGSVDQIMGATADIEIDDDIITASELA